MNSDQQLAYDLIVHDRKNVFLTGSAGCGKSYLIRKLYQDLVDAGNSIAVTAMTNSAKENLDIEEAITFHSLLGVGIDGQMDINELRRHPNLKIDKLNGNDLDIIFVDEISMVHPAFMDNALVLFYLSQMLAESLVTESFIRNANIKTLLDITLNYAQSTPLQVQFILTGDLHQIPPVTKEEDSHFNTGLPHYFTESRYIQFWRLQECTLKIQQRQCDDPNYSKILQCIRKNRMDDFAVRQFLSEKEQDYKRRNGHPHKSAIHIFNRHRPKLAYLQTLHSNKQEYEFLPLVKLEDACDAYYRSQALSDKKELMRTVSPIVVGDRILIATKIQAGFGAPQDPVLAEKGMRGVILKLTTRGKRNASNGPLIANSAFIQLEHNDSILEAIPVARKIYRMNDNQEKKLMYTLYQPPIISAEAMTIHSVQGQTLPSIVFHYDHDLFVAGQLYVALSRVPKSDAVYFDFGKYSVKQLILNQSQIKYNPAAMSLQIQEEQDGQQTTLIDTKEEGPNNNRYEWSDTCSMRLYHCVSHLTAMKDLLSQFIEFPPYLIKRELLRMALTLKGKSHNTAEDLQNIVKITHWLSLKADCLDKYNLNLSTSKESCISCPQCRRCLSWTHFLNFGLWCPCKDNKKNQEEQELELLDAIFAHVSSIVFIVQSVESVDSPWDATLLNEIEHIGTMTREKQNHNHYKKQLAAIGNDKQVSFSMWPLLDEKTWSDLLSHERSHNTFKKIEPLKNNKLASKNVVFGEASHWFSQRMDAKVMTHPLAGDIALIRISYHHKWKHCFFMPEQLSLSSSSSQSHCTCEIPCFVRATMNVAKGRPQRFGLQENQEKAFMFKRHNILSCLSKHKKQDRQDKQGHDKGHDKGQANRIKARNVFNLNDELRLENYNDIARHCLMWYNSNFVIFDFSLRNSDVQLFNFKSSRLYKERLEIDLPMLSRRYYV